ncbi:MAG: class I SAM-dependent methyltransferase [Xanthomonadales bacterium]|nr:class I SAM-dependent methyltransferase [Xanthomonadales bacterium]
MITVENVSQLILRHRASLPEVPIELIGPAADGLFREIATPIRPVKLATDRFGVFRVLEKMGADVRFEPWAKTKNSLACIILNLPREKARLAMRLHEASARLAPGGRLFLAGANRAGIKSSPRVLDQFFFRVEKRDSARHCTLFEASDTRSGKPFEPNDYEHRWTLDVPGASVQIASLPGVFAHGRLDLGSALLLDSLQALQPSGRILDFACGAGVIGLALLATGASGEVTLLDDSALALECAGRSLEINGLRANRLASDGLSEANGRYDWIVSNPPFHQGVNNDLDVARAFFRDAGTFLAENGRICVVFNRHLPYGRWLRESFNRVEILAQNREFTVLSARNKQ